MFAARATVLEELGRDSEAEEWQRRAVLAADALDAANGTDDLEVLFVEEVFEESDDDAPVEDAAVVEEAEAAASDGPIEDSTAADEEAAESEGQD